MTVHMTITDIEEYSLRSNTVLDCTMYNQITVGNVTLPKAVLSTVKIFVVCSSSVLTLMYIQAFAKIEEQLAKMQMRYK